MNHVLPFKGPLAGTRAVPRALYIGPAADEFCNILSNHIGRVETSYEQDVQAAFAQLRRRQFDVVFLDQRDENLATRLILPVLQSIGYPVQAVVISTLSSVSHYLAVPGVARVLSAPLKEAQVLRVLGLERRTSKAFELASELRPETANATMPVSKRGFVQAFSDRFMNLVSTLYKRAAFVLLFTLFIAFAFYGVLIGFFLLSTGWGAPLTLTRGHEMVNKVEREITEVSVALNQTEQRISEQAQAKSKAERDYESANNLAHYAAGTVGKEIEVRTRQYKSLVQAVKKLKRVRNQLAAQVDGGGASGDLQKLYSKRLINKNTYSAGVLNLVDASQKLAALDIEIEAAQNQITEFENNRAMLQSLKTALESGDNLTGLTATSSEMLLLTKQSSDSLAARALAKSELEGVERNMVSLTKSRDVLEQQLATLGNSPLARALEKRVDVVFVPYGSERQFAEGRKLFSCAFTIFFCRQAGTVGKSLPGETSAVHPFFGKPVRGSFVEMHLDNPDAAMREIIHGTRKPFFF